MKTATEFPVRTLEDGRLSIDPAPVTLTDLGSATEGLPSTVLLRLWFSIQWGDEPAILSAYAPVVADRLRPRTVLRAWDVRRGSIIGSRPRNFETTRSGEYAIVTFVVESRSHAPAPESATMIRVGGRWRILHDTMLESALAADAQSRASPGQDPPSAAAVLRGIQASMRFRDLAAAVATRR